MFQTTNNDVVISGHGATLPADGRVTRVPEGVEFIMFGPPGTTLSDNLGQMLEGGQYISQLFIVSGYTSERSPLTPSVLTSKSGGIPNLILGAPRQLNIGGMGVVPHIIGVEKLTHLHDLWQRVRPFIKPNQTTRVIWAACSAMGSKNPFVDGV